MQNIKPKISIIMANYNYGKYIAESIESILKQTCKEWELIIVDNGSSDGSWEIIQNYAKKYSNINCYQHQNAENKGLVGSLKLAITKVNSDYIAFLESDDIWYPNYLEEKLKIAEKYPEVVLIFNKLDEFGDKAKLITYDYLINYLYMVCENIQWPTDASIPMQSCNLVASFSVCVVRTDALLKCNFDNPLDPVLDYWLWNQLASFGKWYFINKRLTRYRLHAKSYSDTIKVILKDKLHDFSVKLYKIFKKTASKATLDKLYATFFVDLFVKRNVMRMEYFKKQFAENVKGKKIYLYGAGVYAKSILENNDLTQFNISGIFDIDKNKVGTNIAGYPIHHKDEIKTLKPDVIILCLAEEYYIYYELLNYLLSENLPTIVIPNFFDNLKNKPHMTKEYNTVEELFLDLR